MNFTTGLGHPSEDTAEMEGGEHVENTASKELWQLTRQKTKEPIVKKSCDFNRYFNKGEREMATKLIASHQGNEN